MRILIADDHEGVRFVVCQILAADGHEVVEARDGAEALQRVAAAPPDLILLDQGMPRMDGSQFLCAYRQLPGSHAPVVLLARAGDTGDTARELGADAFLIKPFEMDALREMVERFAGGTGGGIVGH